MIGAFSFLYSYRDTISFCQYREFDKNADSAILVCSNALILNWFGDYRSLRFLCGYFGSRTFYLGGNLQLYSIKDQTINTR